MLSETEVWSFVGDTFRLQLTHNTGAFLSLGATLPEASRVVVFSLCVGLLLMVLLGYILFSKSVSYLEILAYSLLLTGDVGNLIDRVQLGYVIDFMNIGIGTLRSGIFNVADMAVTPGVLVLIADSIRRRSQSH